MTSQHPSSQQPGMPGSRVIELVALMDRLRSPGGCPWDAEQTHESLVEYLVEETYETVDAIDANDRDALREELGDVLLQVVFHARIAAESADDPWTIDDVADGIINKLIERHPHVFGDDRTTDLDQLESDWFARKRKQKGRTSAVDGVPPSMPSVALAHKLMTRAQHAQVDVSAAGQAARQFVDDAVTQGIDPGELMLAVIEHQHHAGGDADRDLRTQVFAYREAIIGAETTQPEARADAE